jgi:hypothetical protein
MPRTNGSRIGPASSVTASTAGGIWTLRQAQQNLSAGKWPSQPPVPGAPTATAGDAQVSLSWTAPTVHPSITDYYIQYSSNSGTTWTTFSDSVSNTTSATVTGLTNGTAYIFRIAGVNALGEGLYGSASASATPFALDVVLLMHFNGSNGSTTFTDSSSYARTGTASGATISTSQSKFGGASGVFDGDNDEVVFPESTDFAFDSDDDFTIEAWVYPLSVGGGSSFVATGYDSGDWFFGLSDEAGDKGIGFGRKAVAWDIIGGYPNAGDALATDQWQHIAVTRHNGTLRTFIDGNIAKTETSNTTAFPCAGDLAVGSHGGYLGFDGYIDEFRIVKGTAVYTAAFTPPTAPF